MSSPENPSTPIHNTSLQAPVIVNQRVGIQPNEIPQPDSRETQENLERLVTIAREVAQAAGEKLETDILYERREKGVVRKFLGSRSPYDRKEGIEGWVIVPPTAEVIKKAPGKANLTDNSGLGLILTRDGKLYGSVSWPGMRSVKDRLEHIKRVDIQRKTFIYKEKGEWYQPPMPEDTFLPRYRPMTGGAPTLIGNLNNPDGGLDSPYFTPYVIGQCYDALANFVEANNLHTT